MFEHECIRWLLFVQSWPSKRRSSTSLSRVGPCAEDRRGTVIVPELVDGFDTGDIGSLAGVSVSASDDCISPFATRVRLIILRCGRSPARERVLGCVLASSLTVAVSSSVVRFALRCNVIALARTIPASVYLVGIALVVAVLISRNCAVV